MKLQTSQYPAPATIHVQPTQGQPVVEAPAYPVLQPQAPVGQPPQQVAVNMGETTQQPMQPQMQQPAQGVVVDKEAEMYSYVRYFSY